jgi:hypothetical protein
VDIVGTHFFPIVQRVIWICPDIIFLWAGLVIAMRTPASISSAVSPDLFAVRANELIILQLWLFKVPSNGALVVRQAFFE